MRSQLLNMDITDTVISPHSLESDGMADRMNCTLLEKLSTLLHGAVLSEGGWRDTTSHAGYLYSRTELHVL